MQYLKRMGRKGLTLIELLVVLVILVALAGILVPLLPDVQQQAHGGSGADNMKEIAKALQLHKFQEGSFPNDWDSLIDANGVTGATTHLVATDISAPAAASDEERIVAALADASIDSAFQHTDFTDATVNQTFEGLTDPAVNELGTTGNVATLNAAAETELGLEQSTLTGGTGDTVAYVAFGLGANSSAVGVSMLDAPIHYLEGGESPIELYARWVVVFKVPAEGPLALAGIYGVEEGEELVGLDTHLAEYYEALE